MPVAEIGKIYEYKGKKYVAVKHKGRIPCVECALCQPGEIKCRKMMRDGVAHTCYDEADERNDVIFAEAKEK